MHIYVSVTPGIFFLVLLHWKMFCSFVCFCSLTRTFKLYCAEWCMYINRLTVGGSFYIYLLKEERLSVFTLNLSFRLVYTSRILWCHEWFEANHWSNMQFPQVWCGNLKLPVHIHREWTSQWHKETTLVSYLNILTYTHFLAKDRQSKSGFL